MVNIETVKSNIWTLLKAGREVSLEEFYLSIPHLDKKELVQFLDAQVKRGFLRKTGVGYQLKQVLLPPFEFRELVGTYKYEKVQQGATSIPQNYMNPNIKYLVRKEQGERGVCVGCAMAYGRELDYIKLTKSYPEITDTRRNLVSNIGACSLIHDEGYPGYTFSAQCAYVWSRQDGKIDAPEGSYVDVAVETLRKRGCVFEENWFTPKTHNCAPDYTYPDSEIFVKAEALNHVIDGYSTSTDFYSICRGIFNNGYAYMPVNIYSNYTQNGGQGLFPDPNGDSIGGHALCWVGYDLDKEELYCIHSWMDGWSYVGGITKRYWMSAAGGAFIPLDATEVKVAQKNYKKVHLQSNYACTFTMGIDKFKGTDWYVMLELDKDYFCNARVEPSSLYNVDEIDATFHVSETDGNLVTFTFERVNLGDKIRAMIMEILKKLKIR